MDVIEMILQYIKSKLLGEDYINQEYILDAEKVLHITDTPKSTFSYIEKLIQQFNPEYIIHTGDLVDNIKLELYPYKRDDYKKEVKGIIDILERSNAKEIYVVVGNHDDLEIINALSHRITIIDDSQLIDILGKTFLITHNADHINKTLKVDYILYGHNFLTQYDYSPEKYFNGLNYIYILYPRIDQFVRLKYPLGTNDQRLQKSKLGI